MNSIKERLKNLKLIIKLKYQKLINYKLKFIFGKEFLKFKLELVKFIVHIALSDVANRIKEMNKRE